MPILRKLLCLLLLTEVSNTTLHSSVVIGQRLEETSRCVHPLRRPRSKPEMGAVVPNVVLLEEGIWTQLPQNVLHLAARPPLRASMQARVRILWGGRKIQSMTSCAKTKMGVGMSSPQDTRALYGRLEKLVTIYLL